MFTGIVEEVGNVTAVREGRLAVAARAVVQGTKVGDSISVNGACLTVVAVGDDGFAVDVMPETLRRTNIGSLRAGQEVNLERALASGGRVGGHFVQGHIDGVGEVLSVKSEGEAVVMSVRARPDVMRYLVEKGFIAVDGISLTVMGCAAASFSVSLVGHTLKNTTLSGKKAGSAVNLEVDIMAKYVEKLGGGGTSAITPEFLSEHGFLA